MTTAIEMCSRALVKIGAGRIQSFTEGTDEASAADALYALTRDSTLSSYPWVFAFEQAPLVRQLPAPTADYAWSYALPADLLIVRSLGATGRGRGAVYRIAGGVVQTDAEEVVVTYTRRVPEEEMPAYFQAALVAVLAAELVIPLTESTARWQGLQQRAETMLREARRIDAQQSTPPAIESWPLIEARG